MSFHPSQYVLLNSPDPALTRRSTRDLSSQAEMLDRMELGPDGVERGVDAEAEPDVDEGEQLLAAE